jgi:mRNA interferase YafQ
MRQITRTGSFKRDYKRVKKAEPKLDALLVPVLTMLAGGVPLPPKFSDHPLTGKWTRHRDCHLKPDLVLIYKVDQDELTLVRLGSHSELFG